MKKFDPTPVLLALPLCLLGCGGGSGGNRNSSATPIPTSATPIPTSATPVPTSSPTPKATPTPTATPTPVATPTSRWAGKKLLWLGTSIPAVLVAGSYPALVAKRIGCKVENNSQGESGVIWDGRRAKSLSATTTELAAVFPGSEQQSFQKLMLGKKADLVIFDHGYNDRYGPIGTLGNGDRSTFLGAMEFLIDQLRHDNPGAQFAFITPPTRYALVGEEATNERIRAAILALAAKYGAPCLDLMEVGGFNAQTQATFTDDDLHPNAAGVAQIAGVVSAWLLGMQRVAAHSPQKRVR